MVEILSSTAGRIALLFLLFLAVAAVAFGVSITIGERREVRRRLADGAAGSMDADGIAQVGLINYVSPDLMGFTPECNEWMLRYASAAPDRLLAFGSVHPAFSDHVADDARRLVERGVRAFKVHPPHQQFEANAYLGPLPQLAELYQVAMDARLPVTIHTGTSIFPGARSRLGIRAALARGSLRRAARPPETPARPLSARVTTFTI